MNRWGKYAVMKTYHLTSFICFGFLCCYGYLNLWLAMFYYHKWKIENNAFNYSFEIKPEITKRKKTKENVREGLFKSIKSKWWWYDCNLDEMAESVVQLEEAITGINQY